MKISYNWLKQYINTKLSVEEIAEVLTSIGLEVEGLEKIEVIPGGLKGVVVGEVLTCAKHPDADKLSLATVNLGSGDPVQIVCGAPNVASGQKVLVATIGTTLHPTSGEPFIIQKSKIRGAESNGMICAEDELGLGENHAGIIVLDNDAVAGTAAADYLKLETDFCLEIGLTPNRTDAFSHVGVARDLAAALRNMEGREKENAALNKPIINPFGEGEKGKGVKAEVKNSDACPRYCGLTMHGLKVAPSPKWLQDRLTAIGQRTINNVVDITNYVQHEIGQPLHAFDADAISGNTIVVRLAREGEKFVTLDSVERTLNPEDLMICDKEKPLCIAGVFGGTNTAVTETTTSIFLESAYFNPLFVRKTAKRHGLHTDASFRFERGCDPNSAMWALKRAANLIQEFAGGEIVSDITDLYPAPIENCKVKFRWERAASLIGKEIEKQKVKNILRDLDIEIENETVDSLQLSIPLYRADVTREADVVEEVLRIYGYNNIEIPKQMRTSLSHSPKPDPEKLRDNISNLLATSGFIEIMGLSLTRTAYLELAHDAEHNSENAVAIVNPLSSDLGVMRQTLLYSGLQSIALNQNHRNPDLRLFEFGKAYSKSNGSYNEEQHLSIFLSGRRFPESWNNTTDVVSFSDLKGVLENVFSSLGIPDTTSSSAQSNTLDDSLDCFSGKIHLARLGNVSSHLLKEFDIKQPVWYADVKWENVIAVLPQQNIRYTEPEKFPAVRRDLSMLLDKQVTFADIEKTAFATDKKLLRSLNLFDVFEGKNLEEGKKSYAISFMLQDKGKTMTDQQVEMVMTRIQKSLEEKLGVLLRS